MSSAGDSRPSEPTSLRSAITHSRWTTSSPPCRPARSKENCDHHRSPHLGPVHAACAEGPRRRRSSAGSPDLQRGGGPSQRQRRGARGAHPLGAAAVLEPLTVGALLPEPRWRRREGESRAVSDHTGRPAPRRSSPRGHPREGPPRTARLHLAVCAFLVAHHSGRPHRRALRRDLGALPDRAG